MQFYLRPPGESGEGALDFFHRQLAKAVRKKYLGDEESSVAQHQRLANHFYRKADPSRARQWDGNYPRGLSELPYHLLEGQLHEELFRAARDETFLAAQTRAFPDEPDLHLKTIQAAIEGAARSDAAGAMAEFMLAHAERILEAGKESPLSAVRAGQLERAWKLADLYDIKRCASWYLLIAWEMKDSGRIEQAQETLVRLQKKDLVGLESWQSILLLWQVAGINEEAFEALRTHLLDDVGRAALHVFCQGLVDQGLESAKSFDGPWTWADFLRAFFTNEWKRTATLRAIADKRAQEGDLDVALETLINIGPAEAGVCLTRTYSDTGKSRSFQRCSASSAED